MRLSLRPAFAHWSGPGPFRCAWRGPRRRAFPGCCGNGHPDPALTPFSRQPGFSPIRQLPRFPSAASATGLQQQDPRYHSKRQEVYTRNEPRDFSTVSVHDRPRQHLARTGTGAYRPGNRRGTGDRHTGEARGDPGSFRVDGGREGLGPSAGQFCTDRRQSRVRQGDAAGLHRKYELGRPGVSSSRNSRASHAAIETLFGAGVRGEAGSWQRFDAHGKGKEGRTS
jgi:hypothetical protein